MIWQIESTNFSSIMDMKQLLESLYQTFTEFKTHEQIENKLIVKKLSFKMHSLAVNTTAVCNCHKVQQIFLSLHIYICVCILGMY